MILFLLAIAGLRLEVGTPKELPPDVQVVRVFPEDLLRIEGRRAVPLRGGVGVAVVKTRRGLRPVRVEVHPYREVAIRPIPPRVVVPPGEEVSIVSDIHDHLRAMAFPEERVRLEKTDRGLVVRCERPGRAVVFLELQRGEAIQFGRTLVSCLPGEKDFPWWEPLYLRKGERREIQGFENMDIWAQGGVMVRREDGKIQIQGVEPGTGAVVVAHPGRGRVRIPVFVDIPPLFPPQVLTLPVDRLDLPPDVDSVQVFPPRALKVYLDGTVEIHRPVPVAHVEVWKDGRVGVITLIGHRPRPEPERRFRPRRRESPFRRPR